MIRFKKNRLKNEFWDIFSGLDKTVKKGITDPIVSNSEIEVIIINIIKNISCFWRLGAKTFQSLNINFLVFCIIIYIKNVSNLSSHEKIIK